MQSTNTFQYKAQGSRLNYLDIFRSLGIILMVMGHIGYGKKFDYFIHAFHMPMFFWISGYLFCHRSKDSLSFQLLLIKKAKSLLLPYTVFGTAHYLLYIIKYFLTYKSFDISPLIHLLSVNTDGLPISGALWFLTALYFTDILFFLIDKYFINRISKMLVVLIIALIGNYTRIIFPFTLPFAIGPSFVGIGLYYMGYLCKKHENKKIVLYFFNLKWCSAILLGIITTLLIFKNGYINMRTETYSNIPLFWINALLSIVVGISLSKLIYKLIQNSVICDWLTDISKYSIIYACLNQVVIELVGTAIGRASLPESISSILILISTMLVLYVISTFFANTKLKFC